jgi:hypothetical protein
MEEGRRVNHNSSHDDDPIPVGYHRLESAAMPARAMFPALQRLDAAFASHRAAFPHPPLVGDSAKYQQAFETWIARRDDLVAELATVMAEVGPDLCTRCSGTGLTNYTRHNGMCYLCQGDGWSARGRRRYAAGLITGNADATTTSLRSTAQEDIVVDQAIAEHTTGNQGNQRR